jgi:hypothetical protein
MSFSLSRVLARVLLVVSFVAPIAHGAQRTFVSARGNDANTCALSTPCRSFARALAVTDPAGEVVVLDSGGYGAVSISQSVTISAPDGIYAGVSVFSGAGVTVNTAGIEVTLRGLAINFQGGSYGIEFVSGKSLVVDRCSISGAFIAGINQLPGSGSMFVRDTLIAGMPGTGDGVGTWSVATLERTTITGTGGTGLYVADGGVVTMRDSLINAAGGDGVFANAHTGGIVNVYLDTVTVAKSGVVGVEARSSIPGSKTYIDVIRSQIVHTFSVGVQSFGDQILPGLFGFSLIHITDSLISNNAIGIVSGTNAIGQVTSSGNTVVNNGTGWTALAPNGMFSMGNNQVRDNAPNIDGPVTVLTYN